MTTYRIADGYNVPLVSLTALSPQPRSKGIQYARRTYGGDGTVYDEGPFIELEWDVLQDDVEYDALIDTVFGVSRPLTNEITIYLRDQYFAWVRYNGIAVSPENARDLQWRQFFPRDITIIVKHLAIAS